MNRKFLATIGLTVSAVIQSADESFNPGGRVRVLSDGATSRVSH